MERSSDILKIKLEQADRELYQKYAPLLVVNPDLNRKLVSFQGNKHESESRWCKYKEGFSSTLVRYIFDNTGIQSGRVLDPFSGSGTTLFTACDRGIDSVGIELLPSSAEMIEVRQFLRTSHREEITKKLRDFKNSRIWEQSGDRISFHYLKITQNAFPVETKQALERYLYEISVLSDRNLSRVLRFVLLCILESISYTRKDGQYLRWDWRSGRNVRKTKFDKGKILGFTEAIDRKIEEIYSDLLEKNGRSFADEIEAYKPGNLQLLKGSCLDIFPALESSSFDGLVTSPPYCNRYDYTRTYALELNLLGLGEEDIKNLRQTMLSCTVENREKENLNHKNSEYERAILSWQSHPLLNLIFEYLEQCREEKKLNNTGIPRMVQNYFKEMVMIIFTAFRILKQNAPFVMVNDNVRYQGVHIPVDLILSDFAKDAGLEIEKIWVLPRGKGNSSQQMGRHGREEIRKSVYVWRKLAIQE
ncbi:MAG: site-specific DNA-methyltransferase [Cyanobacteria bacterium SBLK]|nr:site-specific DNA-methyltransferase [Cyanobacteria bacterium SBLK]